MHFFRRISWTAPASVVVIVWVLAAAFGSTQLFAQLPGPVHTDRLAEDVQRNRSWSPIYGFADVCQARIPASANVLLVDPSTTIARDEEVFAYVLYPVSVSAVNAAPSDWAVALSSSRYVAIWQQRADPSADPPTAAGARLICSYTSPDGDRGVVYVASSNAGEAAISAPAAPFGGRIGAYLRVLAGLGSLWLIGFVVIRAISSRSLTRMFAVGASLPLGCLAVTLELITFSVLRITWSGPSLVAPWFAVGVAMALRDRKELSALVRQVSAQTVTAWWTKTSAMERVAFAAFLALGLVIVALAPIGLPSGDGFDLYFKSHAFYTSGSILPYYEHADRMSFSSPAQPPLVSLGVTWLYLFIGQVDEHSTLLLWPALLVSMLCAFYALIASRLPRPQALWLVLAAALIGYQVTGQAFLSSSADLPLTAFLLVACACFWLWGADERRPGRLPVLAGLFLGGAALTQEEGVVVAALVLAASPLLSRPRLLLAAASLPIVVAVVAPWLLLRPPFNLSQTVAPHSTAPSGGLDAAPALLVFVALAVAALLGRSRSGARPLAGRFWFLIAVIALLLAVTGAATQVLPLVFLASVDLWLLVGAPLPLDAAAGASSRASLEKS